MEIDLDPETVDALAAEADERGFESPEAYASWLLEHRESILRPPGEQLAARLERVEGQLQRLRRTLEDGFATEITVESGAGGLPDASAEGEWFDENRASGEGGKQASADEFGEGSADDIEDSAPADSVSEFAYSDSLEPPAEDAPPEPPIEGESADAADDDEIAEALAEVELEDENEDVADDTSEDDGSDSEPDT
ncbi:hypothetical protein [Halorhabdus amylolytica]|uniref:hypothetical protein n=1 Tax=Halorhabdus amylolytica TaxID=2559573 RepID=UPI0010AA7140|nr:hypothetical protein [Halorhabdus amylolytica]